MSIPGPGSQSRLLRLPASCDPPSEGSLPSPKIWLIFGATGQIGRSVVDAALGHGDKVAAVGRMMEDSIAQMQGWHELCLGLLCDVRVPETVVAAVQACIKHFGSLDIVVNCTGYGVIAACEDQDASDVRSQLDTNFWGTVNIIHATLPYFRERAASLPSGSNAGRYLIFSSTSGALGVPGLGPYCATKYATEALIESMLYEIDAFGIKATLVEPGHLRQDDKDARAGSAAISPIGSGESVPLRLKRYGHFFVKPPSPAYASPTAPARHAQRVVRWLADHKPTSAVRSAELVWQLGHCRFPPLRLLLGSFAVESVRDRLRSVIEEIEDWKFLSFPTADDTSSKGKGKEVSTPAEDGEAVKHEGHEDGDEKVQEHGEDSIDVDDAKESRLIVHFEDDDN